MYPTAPPNAVGYRRSPSAAIGTPPNAIAYSTGYFTMTQMASTGAILTAVMFVLLAMDVAFLIPSLLPMEGAPDWAKGACEV